jgi:undecaprenyl-phosphate 4-deoxy-4-formamido-L-arabinose transferase
MEVSIVIPVYRSIKSAVKYLPGALGDLNNHLAGFEIIFIIDHADSAQQMHELNALKQYSACIKTYALNRNYGQHFATLCGYYLAEGNYIVSIDEDMIRYLPEICKSGEYKSYDVFYWMYDKNRMYTSGIRKAFSILFKILLEKIVVFHENSTYRCIRKSLRDQLLTGKHIFWNMDIMIFKITNRIGRRHFEGFDIKDDESGYNYKKLLRVAFEIPYEHNTLFMNLLISLAPCFAVYAATHDNAAGFIAYALSVAILSITASVIRMRVPPTEKKIKEALSLPEAVLDEVQQKLPGSA